MKKVFVAFISRSRFFNNPLSLKLLYGIRPANKETLWAAVGQFVNEILNNVVIVCNLHFTFEVHGR